MDILINNNIVLECEENWHKYQHIEYNHERKEKLRKLGYKIVACNSDDNYFELINKILLKKQIIS